MRVAVIIPTLEKNKEYLKLCVESLRATVDWDIIVVSNGGHYYPLQDVYGITTRLHTRDQGQCNATNIGFKYVNPDIDYVMVSNDDMYYAPGWNKNLSFDHLVFSPNLVEPVKPEGSADPFLIIDGGFTIGEFNKQLVDETIESKVTAELTEQHQVGFNLPFFIRRDIWDTIGGYDVEYDPWGSNSDTDFQTKVALAGIAPVRLLDVLVYHFSNKSGTFDGSHQAEWQHNFDYYREKWGYTRDDEPKGDPWYHINMILPDKLIYHPKWEGYYAKEA